MWTHTSADAPSHFPTKRVDLGHLLPLCGRAGTLIRGRGSGRRLVLQWLRVVGWGRGGRGRKRRRGGSRSWGLRRWGLGCVGRCGATGGGLGSVMVDAGV